MFEHERLKAAEILDAVLSGHMNAFDGVSAVRELLDNSPQPSEAWKDKVLNEAQHALTHFRDDEDIRVGDEKYGQKYGESQPEWLRGIVCKLRGNLSNC